MNSLLVGSILFVVVILTNSVKCSALSITAYPQSYFSIIFDKNKSEVFGAHNLIVAHHTAYDFTDKILPNNFFEENTFIKKTFGFGYRMTKLFLFEAQQDHIIFLMQHEVFGHGARYREFGHINNSYNLNLYFPFGKGGGFARSGNLKKGYNISPDESLTKTFGGSEASLLLAKTLSDKFIMNGSIHYREASLYLLSQNDLLFYIWNTRIRKNKFPNFGFGDIDSYIFNINNKYYFERNNYDIEKLSVQSLVSLLNPIQFYSAFSILYNYGLKGERKLNNIPMINIGSVMYLPYVTYKFTPFGTQFGLSNHIKTDNKMYIIDVEVGDKTFNEFYSVGMKIYNLIGNKKYSVNLHTGIWNQPQMNMERYPILYQGNKTGGIFKMDFMIHPFNLKYNVGLFLQTGYKTKGYTIGEPLDKSFILRYGLCMDFNQ